MTLSVVIPVYRSEKILPVLHQRLTQVLGQMGCQYELLYVDDRSPDNSWQVLTALSQEDKNCKPLRLVRNFGQHPALSAGLSVAQGDYVVMMDCDLQDEPEQIPHLLHHLQQHDYQIVYAKRKGRQDTLGKRAVSWLFNKTLTFLSDTHNDPSIGTFRIMTGQVKDAYNQMPEKLRYIAGIFYWMGFSAGYVEVPHRERHSGKSSYTLKKMLKLAETGIISNSTKLLSMGIWLGFICAFISFGTGLYFIAQKFIYDIPPTGFSAIIVSLFFTSGLILIVLGIIGKYLAHMFNEIKGRPSFIIEKHLNHGDDK